jgi:hypothetical protein
MAKASTLVRSRVGLLVVALLLVGSALTLQPAANARQTCVYQPLVRTYYNDANHDVEVGQRGTDCDCNTIDWGTTSSYVVVSHLCCSEFTC